MKRVLILGIDGYIGYPLALHLLNNNYKVCGLDNMSRRLTVDSIGSQSATPIQKFMERSRFLQTFPNYIDQIACINMTDTRAVGRVLDEYKPDVIVHLAEQASAPWSMADINKSVETQMDNTIGTLILLWQMRQHCPDAHLVKIGSMGEYGTPDCNIPEGTIPSLCIANNKDSMIYKYDCPMSDLLFPRQPNSFYHLSKVHDTYNIKFACDTWGLTSTDIMQGVVFGVSTDDTVGELGLTRFDYDQYFGTVINRMCAQAVLNHPLTVYGEGNHLRSFLPLKDSIQCLRIAIDNPPEPGEYRTWNQFVNILSINEIATMIQNAAEILGREVQIKHLTNPRKAFISRLQSYY